MNIKDRYKLIIQSKLKMHQAKIEYNEAKEEFESNIMLSESNGGDHGFDGDAVNAAVRELEGSELIETSKEKYVISQLKYKMVNISLHCQKGSERSAAMALIIKG